MAWLEGHPQGLLQALDPAECLLQSTAPALSPAKPIAAVAAQTPNVPPRAADDLDDSNGDEDW